MEREVSKIELTWVKVSTWQQRSVPFAQTGSFLPVEISQWIPSPNCGQVWWISYNICHWYCLDQACSQQQRLAPKQLEPRRPRCSGNRDECLGWFQHILERRHWSPWMVEDSWEGEGPGSRWSNYHPRLQVLEQDLLRRKWPRRNRPRWISFEKNTSLILDSVLKLCNSQWKGGCWLDAWYMHKLKKSNKSSVITVLVVEMWYNLYIIVGSNVVERSIGTETIGSY